MAPKVAMILAPDTVVLIMWVLLRQMPHNVQLNSGLMSILLLVSDYFYGDQLASFVIYTFKGLPETTLTQKVLYFISVS